MKSIFISSTFMDFQSERDILRNQIEPELNKMLKEYGEFIQFCDLRWGIDTSNMQEEEREKKVLKKCLDSIDRARPYMIILIGSRYGTQMDSESIKNIVDEKKFLLNEYEISVTELEIQYGILKNSEYLNHTLIYFRNGNDCDEKKYRY